MANLATRELRGNSLPQRTFRRETTMPRQATDRPDREVNARIRRPDMSGAEELQRILGLVQDTTNSVLNDVQAGRDKKDAAAAALDFASGSRDEKRFKNSLVYRDIYQREGAKKLSFDIGQEVTDAVNERINNSDNPATIEDIDAVIEGVYRKHLYDEHGKLLDFGTPEAKLILANSLSQIKTSLLPQAQKAIKAQMDERMLGTITHNYINELDRGAPIGASPVPPPTANADPLAPLPDGQDSKPVASRVSLGKPLGRLPVTGTITNTFAQHAARGSAGLDIDGQLGDPIVAPAGGRVIEVNRDSKSGLFVKIDHGNGVVSSYAHLLSATVKKGDIIRSGQQLARMGNSGNAHGMNGGDGSHLHYRVRVNGKDVDPQSYRFADSGSWEEGPDLLGAGPQLADAGKGQAVPRSTPVHFEELMHRIPPSVDRGEAKKFFLQALINEANDRNDPSLLNGLSDSMRADGSPSFTPQEVASILSAREAISNRARIDAERAEKDMQEKNEDMILEALMSDHPPSTAFITKAAQDGKVRDEWAFSMVHSLEAEQRAEDRAATAEAREATREAEADIDTDVSSMVAARMSGDLHDATPEDDLKLFQSGALGSGKRAAARLRSLGAARRQGEQVLQRTPGYAMFAAQIKQQLNPGGAAGNSLLQKRFGNTGQGDKVAYAGAISLYRDKVGQGVPPEEAYRTAMAAYGKKQGQPDRRTQLELRRQQLLAKQNAGR